LTIKDGDTFEILVDSNNDLVIRKKLATTRS
jgi:hypothetical protein